MTDPKAIEETTPDQMNADDLEDMVMADPNEAARHRRLAALKAAQGLWKDRKDIPNDGVEAQEQLRAEWH